jgi:hypothetical protein
LDATTQLLEALEEKQMRFLLLFTLIAAIGVAGCSGKSSSNSDNQSNAAATTAADSGAGASPAASGDIPNYPGATTQASGTGSNMGESATGTVLMTDDSFDKVYQWYQQNMPAGSEKSHVTSPIQSAVFMIGEMGKDQQSVTITTQGTKTMITIAHVKSP